MKLKKRILSTCCTLSGVASLCTAHLSTAFAAQPALPQTGGKTPTLAYVLIAVSAVICIGLIAWAIVTKKKKDKE